MMKFFTSLIAAALGALGALSACSEERLTDVSQQPEFKRAVGATYEVVGTVHAYGIRRHSAAEVEYITLIPPPGVDGPEVGFRVLVEAGSRLTVRKVLKTNRLFDPNISLEVRLEGTKMPTDVTTRVDLFRGNEGKESLELNPTLYRKISN